jgi:hypothetical protein
VPSKEAIKKKGARKIEVLGESQEDQDYVRILKVNLGLAI